MFLFCIVSALTATVTAMKTMVDNHEAQLKEGGTISTTLGSICGVLDTSTTQCCYNTATFFLFCLPKAQAGAVGIDTSADGSCDTRKVGPCAG